MRNIRLDIHSIYKEALEKLDGKLKQWIDAAADMQILTDAALPVICEVVVSAMRPDSWPEITLVVDGAEQEAAAWRVLDDFKREYGWVDLFVVRELGGNLARLELLKLETSRRLCVVVRCVEI